MQSKVAPSENLFGIYAELFQARKFARRLFNNFVINGFNGLLMKG